MDCNVFPLKITIGLIFKPLAEMYSIIDNPLPILRSLNIGVYRFRATNNSLICIDTKGDTYLVDIPHIGRGYTKLLNNYIKTIKPG